jgi:anaerobic glycerol-3-phosphate dehydrogenase
MEGHMPSLDQLRNNAAECIRLAEAARTSAHKSFFIEMAERWLTLADDWELAPLGRRYALNVPI